VTDRQIREEAVAGRSLEEIFQCTGAGSCCGTCRLTVARIAADARAAAARPVPARAAARAEQDAA
jgi:bacterioferritin-associated ferredoxin